MITKEQALEHILAITRQHKLTLEEIETALGKEQLDSNKKSKNNLILVFSYLGGVLILAGLSGYIALVWESLNSLSRVIITLGPGIVCMIMSVISSYNDTNKAVVLAFLAALMQTSGLYVAYSEYSISGGDFRIVSLLICLVLAAQYLIFFSKVRSSSFLFFGIMFSYFSFIFLSELLDIQNIVIQFICGISLLALSYGIDRTQYRNISGFGYFTSSALLLWSNFNLFWNSSFELLYLAIVFFMLYLSTVVCSRSILITSIISIFSYISYFTTKYFADSLGWPICMILLGFVFFGSGHFALKLNKKFVT